MKQLKKFLDISEMLNRSEPKKGNFTISLLFDFIDILSKIVLDFGFGILDFRIFGDQFLESFIFNKKMKC